MPTFAQGSRSSLSYITEATFGTTPAGSFNNLPFSTHSLNLSKDRVAGTDIQADRMPRVDRHGNRQTAGDIVADLRKGEQEVLRALHRVVGEARLLLKGCGYPFDVFLRDAGRAPGGLQRGGGLRGGLRLPLKLRDAGPKGAREAVPDCDRGPGCGPGHKAHTYRAEL